MFWWIQVTIIESQAIEEKGLVTMNSGYKYTTKNGIDMVKYHVDSSYLVQDQMNKETEFGGKLSVCPEQHECPLIIFGHDECIFKQFHVTKKAWMGPNGKTVLIPKDNGDDKQLPITRVWVWPGFDRQTTETSK